MKPLLIHNNNTSLLKKFNENSWFSEKFSPSVKTDIDVQLNDFIINNIAIKEISAIFIKTTLSINYLELLGLRLGIHIRLSNKLPEVQKLPIVFLCEETLDDLCRIYMYPEILFSQGVYLTSEHQSEVQLYFNQVKEGCLDGCDSLEPLIKRLNIEPPANYNSHHSIANEWALARYASMFEKDETNESYIKLQSKLLDLNYLKTLHFKYLESKTTRQTFNPKRHTINPNINEIDNKRIGIIDDEINKGWLDFYYYILSKNGALSIPFIDFKKDESKIELIEKVKSWILANINSTEPIDTYIVDLRLHDDDFAERDFDNLSGIQIIKFLKKQNPGIQVVVATASNKVWNYQKCLKERVKYYSVKETPGTYNTRSETISSYIHLSTQISNAVKDSFLAEVYRKIDDLKKNNIFSKLTNEKRDEFAHLTFDKNGLLEQIFNLLVLDNSDKAIIHQCLLIAFQILENYCEIDMIGNFGSDTSSGTRLSSGSIWEKDGSGSKHIFINQTNQKISSWFELVNGRFSFQIQDSNETPVTFNVFESMRLISSYKSGLDTSSLVKMITIIYFRDKISKNDVDRIMALRYYRSNVAAHLTGKVMIDYRINASDIAFFIDVFSRLFK